MKTWDGQIGFEEFHEKVLDRIEKTGDSKVFDDAALFFNASDAWYENTQRFMTAKISYRHFLRGDSVEYTAFVITTGAKLALENSMKSSNTPNKEKH